MDEINRHLDVMCKRNRSFKARDARAVRLLAEHIVKTRSGALETITDELRDNVMCILAWLCVKLEGVYGMWPLYRVCRHLQIDKTHVLRIERKVLVALEYRMYKDYVVGTNCEEATGGLGKESRPCRKRVRTW